MIRVLNHAFLRASIQKFEGASTLKCMQERSTINLLLIRHENKMNC